MIKLLALWSGDLALDEAFWTWTVTVGLLINISTSILILVLIVQDQPLAAMLGGYGLSVPYNISYRWGLAVSLALRRSVTPRRSGAHRYRHPYGGPDADMMRAF